MKNLQWTAYLKAIVPAVAAVVIIVVDKLIADDAIPDEVWLTLLGGAATTYVVPNTPYVRGVRGRPRKERL